MIGEKHRPILAVAAVDVERSVKEVAQITGVQEHVASYAIRKHLDGGTLKPLAFLNPTSLGLERYVVYLALRPSQHFSSSDFIQYLKAHPKVFLVVEIGGRFDFTLGLYVKTPAEIVLFFEEVSKKFGNVVRDRRIASIVTQALFGRKYFFPKSFKNLPVVMEHHGLTEKTVGKVDELDCQILEGLTSAPFQSWSELARRLGLKIATLDQRVKKLKRQGIINRIGYNFKSSAVGVDRHRFLLTASSYSDKLRRQMFRFAASEKVVVSYLHLVGSWDFEIRVEVNSNKEAGLFGKKIASKFGDELSAVLSLPQYDEVKVNYFPTAALLKGIESDLLSLTPEV